MKNEDVGILFLYKRIGFSVYVCVCVCMFVCASDENEWNN